MGQTGKAIAATGVFIIILKYMMLNVFHKDWSWLLWAGIIVIFIGVIAHVIEK